MKRFFVALALIIFGGAAYAAHGGYVPLLFGTQRFYPQYNENPTTSFGTYLGYPVTSPVTQSIKVYPSRWPNNTYTSWTYPASGVQINGFLQFASYGNYYATTPPTQITPKQVSSINTLTIQQDMTFQGSLANSDVICDLFLTQAASNFTNRLFEIEIFFHTPTYSQTYVQSVTQYGTITVSGIVWNVAVNAGLSPPDILLTPSGYPDILTSTIDVKGLFSQLISLGIMTGNEYYNGHSLGAEVVQLSGSLSLNTVSVVYN